MNREKNDYLLVSLLGILLCYFTFQVALHGLQNPMSDYHGHAFIYLSLFTKENLLKGLGAAPYCLWHLVTLFFYKGLKAPLEASAAFSSCVFLMISYVVQIWMIEKVTAKAGAKESLAKAGLISFGLSVVYPITMYWMDAKDGLSANPWHNPTYMAARGFALLCFCLVIDLWGYMKDGEEGTIFFAIKDKTTKHYIFLTILLFLSAMAKPTFAEMFIPTVAFLMLGEWIGKVIRKDGAAKVYFSHCLKMFYCAIPTLMYITVQFLMYFILGGSYGEGGSLIVTHIFEVWSRMSDNVGLSILFGMAFPLFVLLIDPRFFLERAMGKLALFGYVVGLCEAAFLGESGEKMNHGDFLWPMMSGMLLMFVAAVMRLLELERIQMPSKGQKIAIMTAWAMFALHMVFGIIYCMNL